MHFYIYPYKENSKFGFSFWIFDSIPGGKTLLILSNKLYFFIVSSLFLQTADSCGFWCTFWCRSCLSLWCLWAGLWDCLLSNQRRLRNCGSSADEARNPFQAVSCRYIYILSVGCEKVLCLSCVCVLSGLKTADRTEVQNDWMQGRVLVIVATISFGMGVDKANVRWGNKSLGFFFFWFAGLVPGFNLPTDTSLDLWLTGTSPSLWPVTTKSRGEQDETDCPPCVVLTTPQRTRTKFTSSSVRTSFADRFRPTPQHLSWVEIC